MAGGGSAGGTASGSADGTGSAATFYGPHGIAVSSSGTIYVAEWSTDLIRAISPTGTTFAQTTRYALICLLNIRCGDEIGWWWECWFCC